jgi:hypothetical protein
MAPPLHAPQHFASPQKNKHHQESIITISIFQQGFQTSNPKWEF